MKMFIRVFLSICCLFVLSRSVKAQDQSIDASELKELKEYFNSQDGQLNDHNHEKFTNFVVTPDNPKFSEKTDYTLRFSVSSQTFFEIVDGYLIFHFPESFDLSELDAAGIWTNFGYIFLVGFEVKTVEQFVIINYDAIVSDTAWDSTVVPDSVDFEVKLHEIINPEKAKYYRIGGAAKKDHKFVAGPSKSKPFEITEQFVEPKAELQIVFTELISANSPKVNTNQIFTILSKVVNKSSFASPPVEIGLLSDGQSSFHPQKEIGIIAGGGIAQVVFEVTAASESGTENFVVNIASSDVIELDPIDKLATAIIQTPALLQINSSAADGETINLPDHEPYTVTFELVNLGEAAVDKGHYILTIRGSEIYNVPVVREGEIVVGHPILYEYNSTYSGRAVFINFRVGSTPVDSNNLQPAPILDNIIAFTLIERPVFPGENIDSFFIENNPFNPLDGPETFVYTLNADSDVEFRIFTITGEEVLYRKYLSGSQGGTTGTNQIQWDGRNDAGEIVLNGVYVTLLNVLATGETATLKLAVLK